MSNKQSKAKSKDTVKKADSPKDAPSTTAKKVDSPDGAPGALPAIDKVQRIRLPRMKGEKAADWARRMLAARKAAKE